MLENLKKMPEFNEEHPRLFNMFKYGILSLSIATGVTISAILGINEYQRQHAITHLDSRAVSPIYWSINQDPYTRKSVKYGDKDRDGDYDSFLLKTSSKKEQIKLHIAKGLDGKIEFLNLSEKAIDPLTISSSLESSTSSLDYVDIDNDGKYESILQRRNSDGTFVDIPVERGLGGIIQFPTVAPTALNPLQISTSLLRFGKIDYADINGDGKLESIAHVETSSGESYKANIEVVEGKYILNPL